METAISISEILGTIDDGRVEVCATADASYDSAAEKVSVALNAFARRVPASSDDEHVPEPWLPPHERVTEIVPRREAASFAKDVFRSWVRKVRGSVPNALRLRSDGATL